MEKINILVVLLSNIFIALQIIISGVSIYIRYGILWTLPLSLSSSSPAFILAFNYLSCKYKLYRNLSLNLIIACVIVTELDLIHCQLNATVFYLATFVIVLPHIKLPTTYILIITTFIFLYQAIRVTIAFNQKELLLKFLLLYLLILIVGSIQFKVKKQPNNSDNLLINLIENLQISDISYLVNQDGHILYSTKKEEQSILDKIVEVQHQEVSNENDNDKLNQRQQIKDSDVRLQFEEKIMRKQKQQCSTLITFLKSQNTQVKDLITTSKFKKIQVLIEREEFEILCIIFQDQNYFFIKKHAQQSIDQMKDQLFRQLHKVSHDMRTPLNAIINMLQCLSELIDPYLNQRYLCPSLSSCSLLMNLLSDILDVAQLEKNKIRLVHRKFHLQKMIGKLLKIFEIKAEKKSINLDTSFDDELPLYIKSDKHRLKQILINLISNAFKYTLPNGTITLSFTYRDFKTILVEVQDTGIGIKEENIQKLFQDFYKIDSQINQKVNPKGVGLGLQISQELAKLMGPRENGGIKVRSKFGEGSTFYFLLENQQNEEENMDDSEEDQLPAYQVNIENYQLRDLSFFPELSGKKKQKQNYTPVILVSQTEQKSEFMKSSGANRVSMVSQVSLSDQQLLASRKTSQTEFLLSTLANKWNEQMKGRSQILIVDDDEFNIVALQYLLEKFGFHSESAISGKEAIQKVRLRNECPFQLIFMDINMPEIDGEQAAQIILSEYQQQKIIPCTAFESEEEIRKWKRLGMLDPLTKPIMKNKLKQMLYQLFKSDI